jgi:hypothetical protein
MDMSATDMSDISGRSRNRGTRTKSTLNRRYGPAAAMGVQTRTRRTGAPATTRAHGNTRRPTNNSTINSSNGRSTGYASRNRSQRGSAATSTTQVRPGAATRRGAGALSPGKSVRKGVSRLSRPRVPRTGAGTGAGTGAANRDAQRQLRRQRAVGRQAGYLAGKGLGGSGMNARDKAAQQV